MLKSSIRAAWLSVLIAVPVAAVLRAHQPGRAAGSAEPLVFEFLALGSDGRPVADLTASDVELRIDRRSRTIRALEWVPIFDPRTPDGRRTEPLPPPFGSNLAHDGTRTVLLVVDDYSFPAGSERPLREVVGRFLGRLAPRDRVAFVTVPYGGIETDLTTEHERVMQPLMRLVGHAPQTESGSDLACRTRRTLESLTGLLESLRGGEGPTTVLFFSARLAGPRRDAEITRAPGMCELTVDHFRHVGAAAGRARALFYVVQPADVMLHGASNQTETIAGSGFRGSDNPVEGLEHLAGVTGGYRLQLLTPEDDALERVVQETEGYYVLRFEPDPSDRVDARREVQVRVNHPGITVRSRPEFIVPAHASRGAAQTPQSILREGRLYRGVPLRVLAYVSGTPGTERLKVTTVIEPVDPAVQLSSVLAILVDPSGNTVSQWVAPDPAERPLMGALTAPPGLYSLRVAATDAAGNAGSARHDVRVELGQVGPLSMSGLVLGLSRDGRIAPRMDFGSEPVALAFLELYGNPKGVPLAVTFELATTLNGPPIVNTPGVIEVSRGGDRLLVTGAVPVSGLPSGDYVVRAVANLEGHASGRVVRTLRKK